jgi:hypothetical protein
MCTSGFDFSKRSPERSEIRVRLNRIEIPDCASLHPGYGLGD